MPQRKAGSRDLSFFICASCMFRAACSVPLCDFTARSSTAPAVAAMTDTETQQHRKHNQKAHKSTSRKQARSDHQRTLGIEPGPSAFVAGRYYTKQPKPVTCGAKQPTGIAGLWYMKETPNYDTRLRY